MIRTGGGCVFVNGWGKKGWSVVGGICERDEDSGSEDGVMGALVEGVDMVAGIGIGGSLGRLRLGNAKVRRSRIMLVMYEDNEDEEAEAFSSRASFPVTHCGGGHKSGCGRAEMDQTTSHFSNFAGQITHIFAKLPA